MWKTLLELYTFRSNISPARVLQRGLASQHYTRADLRRPDPALGQQEGLAAAQIAGPLPVWMQDLCAVSPRRMAPLGLRRYALAEHDMMRQHLCSAVRTLGTQQAKLPGPPLGSLPWTQPARATLSVPAGTTSSNCDAPPGVNAEKSGAGLEGESSASDGLVPGVSGTPACGNC